MKKSLLLSIPIIYSLKNYIPLPNINKKPLKTHDGCNKEHTGCGCMRNSLKVKSSKLKKINTTYKENFIPVDIDSLDINLDNYIAINKGAVMDRIMTTVKEISSKTRNAKQKESILAFNYMFEQFTSIKKQYNNENIEIIKKKLKNYVLPSIIVRIKGKQSVNKSIILGSHFDAIVSRISTVDAPGANDSGTSCAVNLEVFRSLAAKKDNYYTYEFHLYTAEEWGLKGSEAISKEYNQKNISTISYLNFDMVGWPKLDDKYWNKNIGLTADKLWTNKKMNKYVENLINKHTELIPKKRYFGYRSSDHVSWNERGTPAAFSFETDKGVYPFIHTKNDTYDRVCPYRCYEFYKLGVVYFLYMDKHLEMNQSELLNV